MKLLKIAIDPGQAGAIAVQYPEGETIATPFEDEGTMRDLLKEVKEQANANEDVQIQAVLERVRSMPGQGVASMFKFGQNYGYWRGVLQGLEIPFHEVTPQKWQAGLHLASTVQGTERKKALKQIASERYPNLKVTLKTADALLMLNA